MSRWTLLFALALACWLPLQTALAWLPVQQPVRVDVSASDSSRTSSSSAQELGAVAISDCHGMTHSQPAPVVASETTTSQHACSANSTLKCDTRLRSSEVFLEHLAGLPKSETFSWA